nr:MAG TPA: putative tRNA pseudouridine synthase B [Caudoviricetes sp.]
MLNKTNLAIQNLPKNDNKAPTNDLKTENEQIIKEKQKKPTIASSKPKTRCIVKIMLDRIVYLCPNCKTIVHEDHNYCYECGCRLK